VGQKKKEKMGKHLTYSVKTKPRSEDLTAEELQQLKRSLTKNAKEVKVQMTMKELKKLKKKGIIFKPRGRIVEGDLYDSAQLGREFRGNVRVSKR